MPGTQALSDMRLSCRVATNQNDRCIHPPSGTGMKSNHRSGWLRHDKLKHIGHFLAGA